MTTLALNYLKVQKEFPAINWRAVCCMGFLASLFLLVFYVWQINGLTRGTYLVNSYEKQINKLSSENKNLQVSFAESGLMDRAVAKIQALNFQKTTSVKYIQVSEKSVATSIK